MHFWFILHFKLKIFLVEGGVVKMPAICEVFEEVEEKNNDVNMVEYECISN